MGTFVRRFGLAGAILTAGALAGCGGATTEQPETAEPEPPPPAPEFTNVRVLEGPDGLRVDIAEFGEDEAYLKISGVRSPVQGIVFPITIRENGSRLEYITTWDGRDYYPIHRESMRDGTTRWTLYAPGLSEGVVLEWDEELSSGFDAETLHAEHVEQTRDGTLDRVQTFDREAAEADAAEAIAHSLERTEEVCGSVPEWQFAWDTVTDELMNEKSISGYCDDILEAFRNLCRWDPAKELVSRIETLRCAWIDEGGGQVTLEDGTLSWVVAPDLVNGAQKARAELEELPTEGGVTLGQELVYAQSTVCRSPDGEHVVIVHPGRDDTPTGISYGTTEVVYHSPQPTLLGSGWFFDPRHFNQGNNSSFRGFDLRYYSHVDVDDEENTCELTCGERETEWTLLPASDARQILANAETRPSPFDREPYALARDRRGIYYYVDRGNTPESRRDFRVYRGRRGQMERLEMEDIVSDSEGEIFATASGSLRLLVDNEGAHWIQGQRPKELRRVPVEDNYQLIMEELGVYLGQRLELPCDDY